MADRNSIMDWQRRFERAVQLATAFGVKRRGEPFVYGDDRKFPRGLEIVSVCGLRRRCDSGWRNVRGFSGRWVGVERRTVNLKAYVGVS